MYGCSLLNVFSSIPLTDMFGVFFDKHVLSVVTRNLVFKILYCVIGSVRHEKKEMTNN